jgi:hypothetical protein
MKFICLGYAEEKSWDAMSASERDTAIEKCFGYDDKLAMNGHWLDGGQALQGSRTARTLRSESGRVVVTDGPFAETKEQLGGIGVLEARDMDHAVELILKHPAVRLGPIEIRPADEGMSAEMNAANPATASAANRRDAKFVCLGYMDENIWVALPQSEQEMFMKECMVHDAELRNAGHWAGGEALQYARTAKTLRARSGNVMVTDGPFAETKEQLGGIVLLVAEDMNQAVELMSQHPGIRVGVHLELRPVNAEMNARWEARKQRMITA